MKHHIVSIGVSQHKDASANLSYASKDAREFHTLFTQNVSNVGYSKLLVDQEATLSEIQTALGRELKNSVSSDDAFIFFYSGHGAVVADKEDEDLALSYLVPFDATQDIDSSCLSVNFLKKIFDTLPSKANMIFIDSCFSGHVSKESKAYPVSKTKSHKKLKSFSNTIAGNGTTIFTASKDSEISLEDPEYENGIFTHFVLEELQRERDEETYSVTKIFTPVVRGVTERANERGYEQTPTFNGKLEGDLSLPAFKKRLQIRPDMIEVDSERKVPDQRYSVPEILIGDSDKEKYLNQMINFVLENQDRAKTGDVFLERLCTKLTRKMKADWEEIFQNASGDNRVSEAISRLEASSYQFIMLGGVIASFGSEKQMKVYGESALSILNFREGLQGLVALVSVPEIIVLEIEYLVASICISRNNLEPLKILMFEAQQEDRTSHYGRGEIRNLFDHRYIHYTDALTGSSTDANDHVRAFLGSQDWVPEIAPKIEDKTNIYQLQSNLLFSLLYMSKESSLWPDFARWYRDKVSSFVSKLKKDEVFLEQVSKLFDIEKTEIRKKFIEYLGKYREKGLGKYWWESIQPEDFLTEEESSS